MNYTLLSKRPFRNFRPDYNAQYINLSSSPIRYLSSTGGVKSQQINTSNRVILAHDTYGNISSANHAVFLHGILGSKRNWRTVCNEINKRVLGLHSVSIDHRGHGGSAKMSKGAPPASETVHQCADDISFLIHNHLNISPNLLCAHSFGGKVALKYLETQSKSGSSNSSSNSNSNISNRRMPSDVWILDSIPGPYSFSNSSDNTSQSVKSVFQTIADLPSVFESNHWMIAKLLERGIEKGVAQWLATNIITDPNDPMRKTWEFDINTVNLLFDDFCKLGELSLFNFIVP